MRRLLDPLAVALCAAILTSCGGGGAPSGDSPSTTGASEVVDPFRPFAAAQNLSTEQERAMHDAIENATSECMKSRGFTYQPVPFTDPASTRTTWGDVQAAQQRGYGFNFTGAADGGSDPGSATDPNQAAVAAMTPAEVSSWNQSLNGSIGNPNATDDIVQVTDSLGAVTSYSKSSCRTYGNQQVQGDLSAWITARQRIEILAGEVATRADADPRVTASMRAWAQCMQQHGYNVNSREQAQSYAAERVGSGQINEQSGRSEEIAVATADAECAISSGAVTTRSTVVGELEKTVRDQYQNDFLAFSELQQKAVAAAQSRSAK